MPESTWIFCPVIEDAPSETRKATVFATLEMSVAFLRDVRLYILSFCSSESDALIAVSINPGITAFERIPRPPHSRAVFFENASNAPLLAAYIASPLYPVWALIDDMCVMLPETRLKIIFLIAYFTNSIGVNTFTANIARSFSASMFVTMSSYACAALFTYP